MPHYQLNAFSSHPFNLNNCSIGIKAYQIGQFPIEKTLNATYCQTTNHHHSAPICTNIPAPLEINVGSFARISCFDAIEKAVTALKTEINTTRETNDQWIQYSFYSDNSCLQYMGTCNLFINEFFIAFIHLFS